MKLGTAVPTYCDADGSVPSSAVRRWARRAEEHGFAGLWAMDHLVRPDSYRTTVLDPLVSLSHVAAVTDEIPVGTSILLLPVRRTAVVASQAATLVALSDRDVTLGLGAGYVPAEFEVTGVPMETRGKRLEEGIEVLNGLFSGEASFGGRFHEFEDVRVDPVPADPPRLLAAGSVSDDSTLPPWGVRRALAADGWLAPPVAPSTAAAAGRNLRSAASERGENEADVALVALNYVHVVTDGDVEGEQRRAFDSFFSRSLGYGHAREHCLTGTVDEIADGLRTYDAAGFDQVILCPVVSDPDALDEQLDLLAAELLGRFE